MAADAIQQAVQAQAVTQARQGAKLSDIERRLASVEETSPVVMAEQIKNLTSQVIELKATVKTNSRLLIGVLATVATTGVGLALTMLLTYGTPHG